MEYVFAFFIGAIIFVGFIWLEKHDRKWQGRLDKQLWTERARLVLTFVLAKNLNITFQVPNYKNEEVTGYIDSIRVDEQGDIEVLLDNVECDVIKINNHDTCHIVIDIQPDESGNYPDWALEHDEEDDEEYVDERFPIEISLNRLSDKNINSYVEFDKVLFGELINFDPFPLPLNPFGGVDYMKLFFIKQGGWEKRDKKYSLNEEY